jgi:hypothetical protein
MTAVVVAAFRSSLVERLMEYSFDDPFRCAVIP